MIDIHCHILPSVDDGPDTLEDSLKMIEVAYKDGIRTIIATPHINHHIDFKGKMTIEESFFNLKKEVNERFKDLNIYLGSELYVSDGYLDIAEKNKEKIAINQNQYLLVEFQRNIDFDKILEAVHELRIRGYLPIIAHIEVYPCLMDCKKIEKLKSEGAYIQITGSSILGKQGKETASYLKSLITSSLVDFVASDGHSEKRRRPLLSNAREAVVKYTSEKNAKIIFEENPQKVIDGVVIEKHLKIKKHKKRNTSRSKLNLIAAIIASILMIVGGTRLAGPRDIVLAENIDTIEQVTSGFNLSNILKNDTNKTNDKKEAIPNQEIKEKVETNISSNEQDAKEKEEIISKYKDRLESLKNDYEYKLEIVFNEIQVARKNIKDDEKRTRIVEDYLNEIGYMENTLENQIYKDLYEMQNELEAYGYDVSEVQKFRDEYNQAKMQKREEYLNRIRQ